MAVGFLVVLVAAFALGVTDWTDCPSICRCKWSSGKKTALCKDAGLTALPDFLNSEMQVLDVSENSIHRIQKEHFKNLELLNLQRIFMRNTRLREVHRDAFKDLKILIEIDLSENEISFLDPETFHDNERLRILYLNGNPLKELVKEQFPTLPHLRTLELEACQLKVIHRDTFIHLLALESLNLKGNKLRSLSEKTFMNLHLKSLSLDGNLWKCDCDLRAFRDWFLSSNLQSVSLSCLEPEIVRDRLWKDIPSEEFACPPEVVLTTQSQVQAEAGENVSFSCRVSGDPEPKVTWMFDGNPINHTWVVLEAEEGVLQKWVNISVSNVSEVDAGVYSCVAKNTLGIASRNVTLVLPEVVTATTLSKSDTGLLWWTVLCVGSIVIVSTVCTIVAVCCVKSRNTTIKRRMKASVSFNDQEKKLLDVSIATTDRGTGSNEALGPEMEMIDPPVHITIEREPLPLAVYPPPPEFSSSTLPTGAYGNIFISVSVSRDPIADTSRCPDLLDLPHRPKPIYHGMATLPRRPPFAVPQYDNMGPRITASGNSTLSLPDTAADLPPPPPPPSSCVPLNPEFVSL